MGGERGRDGEGGGGEGQTRKRKTTTKKKWRMRNSENCWLNIVPKPCPNFRLSVNTKHHCLAFQ